MHLSFLCQIPCIKVRRRHPGKVVRVLWTAIILLQVADSAVKLKVRSRSPTKPVISDPNSISAGAFMSQDSERQGAEASSTSSEAEGSTFNDETMCLRILYPLDRHVLSLQEHRVLTFLLRVNCPGLPLAQKLRLESNGNMAHDRWYDLTGDGEEDESLEVDLFQVQRGLRSFVWSLDRSRPGQEAIPEERVVVHIHGDALFEPQLTVKFPPNNFTYKRGAQPFLMAAVTEPQDVEEWLGKAVGSFLAIVVRRFEGSDAAWLTRLEQCSRDPVISVGNRSPPEDQALRTEGRVAESLCTAIEYCELPWVNTGRYVIAVSLQDGRGAPYLTAEVAVNFDAEAAYGGDAPERVRGEAGGGMATCREQRAEDSERGSAPRGPGCLDAMACSVDTQRRGSGDEAAGPCAECSGHGRCQGGVCECEPAYFGATCEYPLLATRVYLPAVHPYLECIPSMRVLSYSDAHRWLGSRLDERACARAALFWEGRAALQTLIAANQNSRRRGVAFPYDITSALGVTLRSFFLALGSAMQRGSPIDFPEGWSLLSFPACESGHPSCYFEPFSASPGSASGAGGTFVVEMGIVQDDPFLTCCRNMPVHYMEMAIPPQFRARGSLWWMSNVADIMLRPNRFLEDMVRGAAMAIDLSDNCIAVHARVGDACEYKEALTPVGGATLGRRCFAADAYLRAVGDIMSAYGSADVFVASDSEEVIQAMQAAEPQIRWKFLSHVNRSQFNLGLPFMLAARLGLIDRQAAVESALLDLFLLRRCRALVGHFSSSFSVLALELMTASHGAMPPFVAVDGPLSLAYGHGLSEG